MGPCCSSSCWPHPLSAAAASTGQPGCCACCCCVFSTALGCCCSCRLRRLRCSCTSISGSSACVRVTSASCASGDMAPPQAAAAAAALEAAARRWRCCLQTLLAAHAHPAATRAHWQPDPLRAVLSSTWSDRNAGLRAHYLSSDGHRQQGAPRCAVPQQRSS
jgi:hypothetical protein